MWPPATAFAVDAGMIVSPLGSNTVTVKVSLSFVLNWNSTRKKLLMGSDSVAPAFMGFCHLLNKTTGSLWDTKSYPIPQTSVIVSLLPPTYVKEFPSPFVLICRTEIALKVIESPEMVHSAVWIWTADCCSHLHAPAILDPSPPGMAASIPELLNFTATRLKRDRPATSIVSDGPMLPDQRTWDTKSRYAASMAAV